MAYFQSGFCKEKVGKGQGNTFIIHSFYNSNLKMNRKFKNINFVE